MGVVGWSIGGGYGSLSKKFGTGPANLLEARDVFVKITQNINNIKLILNFFYYPIYALRF